MNGRRASTLIRLGMALCFLCSPLVTTKTRHLCVKLAYAKVAFKRTNLGRGKVIDPGLIFTLVKSWR